MILARIAAGQIPIRHAADAADLLTALHNLTRLEEGQSTSNVMHGSVDILARIEQLKHELQPATPDVAASDHAGTNTDTVTGRGQTEEG